MHTTYILAKAIRGRQCGDAAYILTIRHLIQKTFCHRVTYTDIYKMFYRELKVIYKHTKEKKIQINMQISTK